MHSQCHEYHKSDCEQAPITDKYHLLNYKTFGNESN